MDFEQFENYWLNVEPSLSGKKVTFEEVALPLFIYGSEGSSVDIECKSFIREIVILFQTY